MVGRGGHSLTRESGIEWPPISANDLPGRMHKRHQMIPTQRGWEWHTLKIHYLGLQRSIIMQDHIYLWHLVIWNWPGNAPECWKWSSRLKYILCCKLGQCTGQWARVQAGQIADNGPDSRPKYISFNIRGLPSRLLNISMQVFAQPRIWLKRVLNEWPKIASSANDFYWARTLTTS